MQVSTVIPITLIKWFVYILDKWQLRLTSDINLPSRFLPWCCLPYQIVCVSVLTFFRSDCHKYGFSGFKCSRYFLKLLTWQRWSSLFSGINPCTIAPISWWFLVSLSLIIMTYQTSCFFLTSVKNSLPSSFPSYPLYGWISSCTFLYSDSGV